MKTIDRKSVARLSVANALFSLVAAGAWLLILTLSVGFGSDATTGRPIAADRIESATSDSMLKVSRDLGNILEGLADDFDAFESGVAMANAGLGLTVFLAFSLNVFALVKARSKGGLASHIGSVLMQDEKAHRRGKDIFHLVLLNGICSLLSIAFVIVMVGTSIRAEREREHSSRIERLINELSFEDPARAVPALATMIDDLANDHDAFGLKVLRRNAVLSFVAFLAFGWNWLSIHRRLKRRDEGGQLLVGDRDDRCRERGG